MAVVRKKNIAGVSAAIDGYKTRPNGSPIVLFNSTPRILRELGVADKPLILSPAKIADILKKHRLVTLDVIKSAVGKINDPVMVLRSDSRSGSLVVVTNIFPAKSGKPVIAAVEIRPAAGTHTVSSIYVKTGVGSIPTWIRKGLLRYINKRKSVRWFHLARLQLPMSEIIKRSPKSLLTENGVVKKNPLDPLSVFTNLAVGVASALQINEYMKRSTPKVKAKRKSLGKTSAQRGEVATNPSRDAHTRTVHLANGNVRSVSVIDSNSGKALAKTKTLAAAKRFATQNGIRLEVNPATAKKPTAARKVNAAKKAPAKTNGIFSDWRDRRRATADFSKTVKLEQKLKRTRAKAKASRTRAKTGRQKSQDFYVSYFFGSGEGHYEKLVTATTRAAAIAKAKRGVKGFELDAVSTANPKRRKAVVKPSTRKRVVKKAVASAKKANPKSTAKRRTYEMFQGRPSSMVRPLDVSRFAPARMDQLGDLIELKLADGQIIKPNPKRFKLCAAGGKLWIAGGTFAKANPAGKVNELNPMGEIDHVVYGTTKPHHGDTSYVHYIHRLGEISGRRPTLAIDKDGFPVIRGGNYRIRGEGIVD